MITPILEETQAGDAATDSGITLSPADTPSPSHPEAPTETQGPEESSMVNSQSSIPDLARQIRQDEALVASLDESIAQAAEPFIQQLAILYAPVQERLAAIDLDKETLLAPYAGEAQVLKEEIEGATTFLRAAAAEAKARIQASKAALNTEMTAYKKKSGLKTFTGDMIVTLSETRSVVVANEKRAVVTIIAKVGAEQATERLAPNASAIDLITSLAGIAKCETEEEAKTALDAYPGFDLRVDRKCAIKTPKADVQA